MHQALLGAAIPYLIAALLYAWRGRHASLRMLIVTPLAMAGAALWAVAPDIPRALGWDALYVRLAQDPRTNIFLWHYAIDRIETDSTWYQVPFVLMAFSLFAAVCREVRRMEEG